METLYPPLSYLHRTPIWFFYIIVKIILLIQKSFTMLVSTSCQPCSDWITHEIVLNIECNSIIFSVPEIANVQCSVPNFKKRFMTVLYFNKFLWEQFQMTVIQTRNEFKSTKSYPNSTTHFCDMTDMMIKTGHRFISYLHTNQQPEDTPCQQINNLTRLSGVIIPNDDHPTHIWQKQVTCLFHVCMKMIHPRKVFVTINS